MRLTIFALALAPVAAHAQQAPEPNESLAQTQCCPVGMVWSSEASACTVAGESDSPMGQLGAPSGCSSHGAPREVMS